MGTEQGEGQGGDREDRGEFVDAEHAAEAELLGLRALLRCLEVMRKKHVIFLCYFMLFSFLCAAMFRIKSEKDNR